MKIGSDFALKSLLNQLRLNGALTFSARHCAALLFAQAVQRTSPKMQFVCSHPCRCQRLIFVPNQLLFLFLHFQIYFLVALLAVATWTEAAQVSVGGQMLSPKYVIACRERA